MAYRAEIQIGVVGIGQLGALQKSLNQVATTVDIINKKRVDAGFNIQNINTYNSLLEKAQQNVNKAAMGSKEELKAVNDLVKAKYKQIAAQERLVQLIAKEETAMRRIQVTSDAGFGIQGPKRPPGSQGRDPGKMAENIALGVGFPLLFGGGPGQVLGGLAGSFVGEGFGGQILGSALGGQLEQLGVSASKAGLALHKPIENFNIIQERALLASSSQERYVKQLIDSGQYIEATAAIQKRYNEVVGTAGSAALLELTKSSDTLNRAWNELILLTQAALAGPLAGLLKWVTGLLNASNQVRSGRSLEGDLTKEQQAEIQNRREALQRGRQRGVLFGGFTPQQAIQEEQAIAARIKQLDQQNKKQELAAQGFRVTEVQQTAALERRGEIQDQITRLRQAELDAASSQLQQDISILSKQQEFAIALNQQAAIIDTISSKKLQSADLEYAKVQRTQQTEVINKQLAADLAREKAVAAEQEMEQLAAANQLTPLKKAELQATVDKLFVAQKDLETAQDVARVVTQRAAAERDSATTLAELERRQQQVAAYAQEAALQTERAARAAEEHLAKLDNSTRRITSFADAYTTINNIQKGILQTELESTTNIDRKKQILTQIYEIDIANAKLALESAKAQIAADIERQRILLGNARLKFEELRATTLYAEAQGVVKREHYAALDAAASALRIADDTYKTTQQVATYQLQAAQAVYNGAIQGAKAAYEAGVLKVNTAAAAGAAQEFAGAMAQGAAATAAAAGAARTLEQMSASIGSFRGEYTTTSSYTAEEAKALGIGPYASKTNPGAVGVRLASGGFITGSTNAVVGEGGPEYVIPAAKMDEAMSRYAQGQRGSSVIPSSINPQVNVTTGPVMNMNGSNYVSQQDFMAGMQTASRRGAEMALEALQNNGSMRRMAGVG